MLLDSAIRARRDDLPDGGALLFAAVSLAPANRGGGAAPPVQIATGPAGDPPPLAVVPDKALTETRAGSRWLAPMTNLGSLLLHGAALAAFLTLATTAPPPADLPSVEVELVAPDAEPPAAAAAPAAPAETPPAETPPVETPPVEIALPPVEDLPLPAELTPPEPVAEAPPPAVDLPPPDTETPPLPEELIPPEQPAVDPATVTIDPPPVLDLPLPAELTPPPRREETPRVEPVPPPRPTPPRREQVRPPVQRERTERQPPRRQPPPTARPPSAASAGRGVTSQPTARTAAPPPSYLGQVMAQLHRAKPAGTGQQGRAVVRFSIQRSGAASGIALAASSGNGVIDQAALAMVRRAAPFPPLPTEFGPPTMALTVPINFR